MATPVSAANPRPPPRRPIIPENRRLMAEDDWSATRKRRRKGGREEEAAQRNRRLLRRHDKQASQHQARRLTPNPTHQHNLLLTEHGEWSAGRAPNAKPSASHNFDLAK